LRFAPPREPIAGYAIVNYDNFTIEPELLDEYSVVVPGLMDKYYADVTQT